MTAPSSPVPRSARPLTDADRAAVENLRALVRVPTVSLPDAVDASTLDAFAAVLADRYPRVHARADVERIADHSLLFRIHGRGTADPVVLMAHYDVVPVDEQAWTRPPFSADLVGEGVDAVVWGRGTLDDKGVLAAILEACERIPESAERADGDIYLSFGFDEETTGSGALGVVAELERRGVRPRLVLDEGGAVVEGAFPGVERPLAVVGVSEKGIATLRLRTREPGGHASTPPTLPATARLARAITRLQRRPFPARLDAPTRAMVARLAPHATGPLRTVFRAVRVTAPLVCAVLARATPETRAMVRTTQAVTELTGSPAANVLAQQATASVNIRIAVGSSVDEVVRHVRRAIRDDAVEVEVVHATEPSPVSPSEGPAWGLLEAVIGEVYPDAIVTPYVMLQASDSRHFTRISDAVYRFLPFDLTTAERASIHAADERIRVDTFLRAVRFFELLLARL
ncbi:carboxypeptidase PM20D1 [Diaminobutyricimonas aerilata]|uniref:Carboxypeptidase PM20D1 n=1 Tax=Diaminobutyricimonas aerilata TaxID=1162967 RepID=A0A2M9CL79_9MICO|nr:M20/M25/M40 family metallo-hydrolase [Diaminobutyricimonas aerilata]PJJ72652.1 carboxypeptidase PM20D1 [Diaminobutyricimonas aerilata]